MNILFHTLKVAVNKRAQHNICKQIILQKKYCVIKSVENKYFPLIHQTMVFSLLLIIVSQKIIDNLSLLRTDPPITPNGPARSE